MIRHLFFACALILTAAISHAQTATEYYNKGVSLKDENKSREAIDAFKEATKLDPNYKEAFYEMGWCYNDIKDYTTALSVLRKARSLGLNWARVYFELGYAFHKLTLIDSAITNYNKCLSISSTYSQAFKQLGYVAYEKDDYTAALEQFKKYEENAKNPVTDYLYWYRKGFMNNALKKYEEAKTALSKSLEFKTDYTNTYLELGFACNKLKQADDAIAWYQKAMALDTKSHIPYNGIAEVYRDTKKDIDMAMTWYQKSLAVKADERKACFGMGYCLNSKGRYSEAMTYLKKAIDQEPGYTAAFVELGYSYYMTGSNSLALENFNKALTLNPANENARYYAGLVYIDQKNKTQAQKMVDELKGLNSKNAVSLQEKVNKM